MVDQIPALDAHPGANILIDGSSVLAYLVVLSGGKKMFSDGVRVNFRFVEATPIPSGGTRSATFRTVLVAPNDLILGSDAMLELWLPNTYLHASTSRSTPRRDGDKDEASLDLWAERACRLRRMWTANRARCAGAAARGTRRTTRQP